MSNDWQLRCVKCETPLTIEETLKAGCPNCGGTAFYTKDLRKSEEEKDGRQGRLL